MKEFLYDVIIPIGAVLLVTLSIILMTALVFIIIKDIINKNNVI